MNDTLKKASERWIREGKTFKDGINAWLDVIYLEKRQPDTPEPLETRRDMADYVMGQIVEFNQRKEYEHLRQLFPPDYDPFDKVYADTELSRMVSKILLLNDNRIIALVEGEVWIISDNSITKDTTGVITFGASGDKEFIAKAYKDKIEIYQGWDGPVVCTMAYPKGYGDDFARVHPTLTVNPELFNGEDMGIVSILVFSNGKRIVLVAEAGIFVIGEGSSQLIHPVPVDEDAEEDEDIDDEDRENFIMSLHYPHADLSPDDQYIATGSQMSCHIVLKEEDGKWVETAHIEPRSSYPNIACFNYHIKDAEGNAIPLLALGSCHFSQSATICVYVKEIEGLEASGYDLDSEAIFVVDDRNWCFSMLSSSRGFMLGDNNGYMWLKLTCDDTDYLHIGGTVMSMDISKDRQSLVVATSAGQIVCYKYMQPKDFDENKNNRQDPYLITNLTFTNTKRYLFWEDQEPLIW